MPQAWAVEHLEAHVAAANRRILADVAAVLLRYPELVCEVHGATGTPATCDPDLAAHFGLDPTSQLPMVMDQLARLRADACLAALVDVGIPRERLYVTYRGCQGEQRVHFLVRAVSGTAAGLGNPPPPLDRAPTAPTPLRAKPPPPPKRTPSAPPSLAAAPQDGSGSGPAPPSVQSAPVAPPPPSVGVCSQTSTASVGPSPQPQPDPNLAREVVGGTLVPASAPAAHTDSAAPQLLPPRHRQPPPLVPGRVESSRSLSALSTSSSRLPPPPTTLASTRALASSRSLLGNQALERTSSTSYPSL